jgi:hypothetical protein
MYQNQYVIYNLLKIVDTFIELIDPWTNDMLYLS